MFTVKSQFPEIARPRTHLELLIPLQFNNGAVLEGYHRLVRSPRCPDICAKQPDHIRSAVRVFFMLAELIAGGHCHPVVGESFQLALPPGGEMGRVAGNRAWSLSNLPPDVVELLFYVHLPLLAPTGALIVTVVYYRSAAATF